MAIPKIIHQVWEGRTEPSMPTRLQILAKTWREQNPDWKYHLWNGEEMDKLVENYFPQYLLMYKNFPHSVQRWDTIRYMILYIYGGIYVDLDTECFRPIDPLLEDVIAGFGEEPSEHNIYTHINKLVGNALIASICKWEGWLRILEEIQWQIKQNRTTDIVITTTGPLMLSAIFEQLSHDHNGIILSYKHVSPISKREVLNYLLSGDDTFIKNKIQQAFCSHYFFGSWSNELSIFKQ